MSECPRCHAQNLPNSTYCDMCGCELARVDKEAVTPEPILATTSESSARPSADKGQSYPVELVPSGPNNLSSPSGPAPAPEPSPQLTLPVSNNKAALPTTSSRVLKDNLLKRKAAGGITSSKKIGNFLSDWLNSCQKILSEGGSWLKKASNSNSNQLGITSLKPPTPTESKGKALCNKIVAALLGVGVLALCIFMIGKKMAIFSISTFIKQK